MALYGRVRGYSWYQASWECLWCSSAHADSLLAHRKCLFTFECPFMLHHLLDWGGTVLLGRVGTQSLELSLQMQGVVWQAGFLVVHAGATLSRWAAFWASKNLADEWAPVSRECLGCVWEGGCSYEIRVQLLIETGPSSLLKTCWWVFMG